MPHISGYSRKKRGKRATVRPAPLIRKTKGFPEVSRRPYIVHLLHLSVREAVKVLPLPSLFRGEGLGRMDDGRHQQDVLDIPSRFAIQSAAFLSGWLMVQASQAQALPGPGQLHQPCIVNTIQISSPTLH